MAKKTENDTPKKEEILTSSQETIEGVSFVNDDYTFELKGKTFAIPAHAVQNIEKGKDYFFVVHKFGIDIYHK